jgi:aminoglycoside phosphotransferase (APT) family kinase protein
MRAVPEPHENWKQALLGGRVEHAHVEQFGHWLGTVHRRSHDRLEEVRPVFEDRTFFETLRLDPYYRAAASRNPEAAAFYAELIDDTLAERRCLAHGDYSPKNVLIHSGRLVLLDFEVAHFGDPAFDLGFALTHLLSKAHHLPAYRPALLAAAGGFWRAYQEAAGAMAADPALEGRAARHALACLLARIDGRSPLEYLTPAEQARQRGWVRQLIRAPARRLLELFDSWARLLESRA